eukprot:jgi/Hompol1/4243/HPOL_003524-RA
MKAERKALRDAYIRAGKMADPEARYTLDSAPTLAAECMDMCPEFERHEREYQKGLDQFERLTGDPTVYAVDHAKAVKRYRRSAAGDPPPLPCDVRPPDVLQKTLKYLFNDIMQTHGLTASYSFVRDRTRSIRNDLTLQGDTGTIAVDLHERIARYHLMCCHELCEEKSVTISQEHEQARKTLQSLSEFYTDYNAAGLSLPNEAEFWAYYILVHPWNDSIPARFEKSLRSEVLNDPRLKLAMHIRSLMVYTDNKEVGGQKHFQRIINNYTTLFQILKEPSTPYLFACCVHIELVTVRRNALKTMQQAYAFVPNNPRRRFNLNDLARILAYNDIGELIETLQFYDIPVDNQRPPAACIGRQYGIMVDGKRINLPGAFNGRVTTPVILNVLPADTTVSMLDMAAYLANDWLMVKLQSDPRTEQDNAHVQSEPIQSNVQLETAASYPAVTKQMDENVQPHVPKVDDKPAPQLTTPPDTTNLPVAAPVFEDQPAFEDQPVLPQPAQNNVFDSVFGPFTTPIPPTPVLESPTVAEPQTVPVQPEISDHDRRVAEIAAQKAAQEAIEWAEDIDKVTKNMIIELMVPTCRVIAMETIFEARKAFFDRKHSEKAFKHWRELTQRRVQARRIADQKRRRIESAMANFAATRLAPIGPTIDWTVGQVSMGLDWLLRRKVNKPNPQQILFNSWQEESQMLEQIAQKAAVERSKWFSPLDIKDFVAKALLERADMAELTNMSLCVKLVLATPALSNGSMASFCKEWLTAKFTDQEHRTINQESVNQQTKVIYDQSQLMRTTPESRKTLAVMVQHFECQQIEPQAPKHNSEALLSGANAAMFQCEWFDGALEASVYWDRQRELLDSFLSEFAEGAGVPLLIVRWQNKSTSAFALDLDAEQQFDMQEYIETGLLTRVSFVAIRVDEVAFDSVLAQQQIETALDRLLRQVPQIPLAPPLGNKFVPVTFPAREFQGRDGVPNVTWNSLSHREALLESLKHELTRPMQLLLESSPPLYFSDNVASLAKKFEQRSIKAVHVWLDGMYKWRNSKLPQSYVDRSTVYPTKHGLGDDSDKQ